MMDFNGFIHWAFQGLLAGVFIWGVQVMRDAITRLNDSVEKLHIKVAEVIEKTSWHEKWLERHEDDIKELKHK